MRKSLLYILLLLLMLPAIGMGAETKRERTNRNLAPLVRFGAKLDDIFQRGMDTSYIGFPEHSWQLEVATGTIGIHSTFWSDNVFERTLGNMTLKLQTTPSASLGFQAGYRTLGFGYSWDLIHAYSRNWNFAIGSKSIGLELMRQETNNLHGDLTMPASGTHIHLHPDTFAQSITSTTLNVYYVLNAKHYSHNAAIKQNYIQRKTAGSLLLQVNYMNTQIDLDPKTSKYMSSVNGIETHQVGVGLGYGINYTPNQGKLLFHLSGIAQLVCLSHNLVSIYDSITIHRTGEADTTMWLYSLYRIDARQPVHVVGTMRAAISWEINEWVHIRTWAQVNNVRFLSAAYNTNITLSNWNWQVNLAVGVRFGFGKKRTREILGDPIAPELCPEVEDKPKLPKWLTDYFFSSPF